MGQILVSSRCIRIPGACYPLPLGRCGGLRAKAGWGLHKGQLAAA